MSPDLFQLILNGGGFAVMIWLVAGMREDQKQQIEWMRQIVQGKIDAKGERAKIMETIGADNGEN